MRVDAGGYSLFLDYRPGSGEGPPVWFLHGMAGTHEDWDATRKTLAGRETVAVDLIGHGRSDGPKDERFYTFPAVMEGLVAAAERVGHAKPVWVGYSMGARLLLHLAIRWPANVCGLVLESGHPGLEEAAARAERALEDEGYARTLETRGLAAFLEAWHRKPAFDDRRGSGASWTAEIAKKQTTNSPTPLARCLRGLGLGVQMPLLEAATSIVAPTLLIAGNLDHAYAQHARCLAEKIHGSTLALVPGAGHNVHQEQPRLFEAALRRFLDGDAPLRRRGEFGAHAGGTAV